MLSREMIAVMITIDYCHVKRFVRIVQCPTSSCDSPKNSNVKDVGRCLQESCVFLFLYLLAIQYSIFKIKIRPKDIFYSLFSYWFWFVLMKWEWNLDSKSNTDGAASDVHKVIFESENFFTTSYSTLSKFRNTEEKPRVCLIVRLFLQDRREDSSFRSPLESRIWNCRINLDSIVIPYS